MSPVLDHYGLPRRERAISKRLRKGRRRLYELACMARGDRIAAVRRESDSQDAKVNPARRRRKRWSWFR